MDLRGRTLDEPPDDRVRAVPLHNLVQPLSRRRLCPVRRRLSRLSIARRQGSHDRVKRGSRCPPASSPQPLGSLALRVPRLAMGPIDPPLWARQNTKLHIGFLSEENLKRVASNATSPILRGEVRDNVFHLHFPKRQNLG